jgi:16S rRNA processing protein RimM
MSRRHRRERRRQTNKKSDIRPDTNGPEYLIVGQIVKPHGVRGELAMKVITEYPERLSEMDTLYLGESHEPYTLKTARPHRGNLLVAFEEVPDRNAAESLRSLMVYVHMDDAIPLEDGEYYLFQLEGIRVITEDGVPLGNLTGFIETGANDVYEITNEDGKTILIPAISQVILNVDLEDRVMTVHLLEGLLD